MQQKDDLRGNCIPEIIEYVHCTTVTGYVRARTRSGVKLIIRGLRGTYGSRGTAGAQVDKPRAS